MAGKPSPTARPTMTPHSANTTTTPTCGGAHITQPALTRARVAQGHGTAAPTGQPHPRTRTCRPRTERRQRGGRRARAARLPHRGGLLELADVALQAQRQQHQRHGGHHHGPTVPRQQRPGLRAALQRLRWRTQVAERVERRGDGSSPPLASLARLGHMRCAEGLRRGAPLGCDRSGQPNQLTTITRGGAWARARRRARPPPPLAAVVPPAALVAQSHGKLCMCVCAAQRASVALCVV
jgi:hypothetical protein